LQRRTRAAPEIVIGAGHNGLVCAAYLARAGLDVVVLERSESLGGLSAVTELWPGCRVPAGWHRAAWHPQVAAELDLRLAPDGRAGMVFAPTDDERGLLLERPADGGPISVVGASPADTEAFGRFAEEIDEATALLAPLLSYPATRRQARRALAASGRAELFARTVEGSIADLAEERFSSDGLQGLVCHQGVVASAAGPRTPGTALLYLLEAAGGRTGLVGGDVASLTDALASDVRAHGGKIRLGAEVTAVVADDARRASGVVLADGEEIAAATVSSSADPKRTVALAGPGALAPEFVEDVELLPAEGAAVKVCVALSGLPVFEGLGRAGIGGVEHVGLVRIAPSVDYLERACRSAAEGATAAGMACEVVFVRPSDPGSGRCAASILAQYVPYAPATGSWDERRAEVGDRVIATLERYAPGFGDLVEERVVLGPPHIEARFGVTGGHLAHGEMLPDWLFEGRPASGWHRHRTPLVGLYLCGAGTHPGASLAGAAGRSAARAILSDRVAAGAR
jgi:phytoene dehydrogenase-like protein